MPSPIPNTGIVRGSTPLPIDPMDLMAPPGDAPAGTASPGLPDTPEAAAILAMSAAENEDGSVTLTPPPEADAENLRELPLGTNFADHLPQDILATLATKVIDGLEADVGSNRDHYATLEDGLAALGLKKERLDQPFPGAAGAQASLMLRAAVRFNATAMGELMPASGPVRSQIVGQAQGIDAAAQRKQKYMNYYLTTMDEGYYPDRDQGLLLLGILGSIFRIVYRDPYDNLPKSRYRTPFNFVTSYHASDSHRGGRFTEIDKLPPSEVKRLQVLGHYLDVPLTTPTTDEADDGNQLRAAEGRHASDLQDDAEHTIYGQHVLHDLPGLMHLGDDGEPTGLPLPWFVVVDRDSRQVLRVDRDWDPEDTTLRPRDFFSHERYMPGLGYYGIGFAHLQAQPQDAMTTLLRQGLNANTLVSFPGGLRVKGARIEQNDVAIGPCEFREIDTGGLPIGNAVMALPYRDVPPSFVPLMELVQQDGEALGQIAEMQIGEGRQDAPVGTTLAVIEQAVRVESAVVKRLHTAQHKELRLIAKLMAEDTTATYPYHVAGQENVPIAPDFAGSSHADIVPVSDPNVPTQTMRMSIAQAKLQLATAAPPGMYDIREANLSMLRTIGCEDDEIARIMPPPEVGVPADPITEIGMLLHGKALAVAPMQMHDMHIKAHLAQMKIPSIPPPMLQSLMAHIGDHLATLYRMKAAQAMGIQLPPPGTPMPPQIEAQLSTMFAPVADAITAEIAPLLQDANEKADPLKAQELAVKSAALKQKEDDSRRKAEQAARQDATQVMQDAAEQRDHAQERAVRMSEMAHEQALAQIDAAEARMGLQETGLKVHGQIEAAEHQEHTAQINARAARKKAGLS